MIVLSYLESKKWLIYKFKVEKKLQKRNYMYKEIKFYKRNWKYNVHVLICFRLKLI